MQIYMKTHATITKTATSSLPGFADWCVHCPFYHPLAHVNVQIAVSAKGRGETCGRKTWKSFFHQHLLFPLSCVNVSIRTNIQLECCVLQLMVNGRITTKPEAIFPAVILWDTSHLQFGFYLRLKHKKIISRNQPRRKHKWEWTCISQSYGTMSKLLLAHGFWGFSLWSLGAIKESIAVAGSYIAEAACHSLVDREQTVPTRESKDLSLWTFPQTPTFSS